MNLSRWALGGLVGGAVGALIWAAMAYFLEVEVGWIAWLAGVLVGVGVRIAAQDERPAEAGWIAAAIALLAIAAGKYAAVELAISQIAWADELQITSDQAIASIATEIATERGVRDEVVRAMGEAEGEGPADLEQLFPPDIWREARGRWERLGPEGQRSKVEEIEEAALQAQEAVKGLVRREGFLASFSAYDILWALLAIGSAFKIATAPPASA
jgi:hypothetical protein